MALGNRRPRQKMTLGNAQSNRVQRTRRGFGQAMHSRPMPAQIHLRAWTPEGELVGVAQVNDRFMVALFDQNEKALAPPVCFTGSQARSQAASLAAKLTGRNVRF
jgi:hypothetical protein